MRRHDLFARILGVVVFIGGVLLLALVFWMAYNYFNAPISKLPTAPTPGSNVPASSQLGHSALELVGRIALLVVMALISSLIAARGIQLYFASINHARHDAEPPAA